MFFGKSDAIKPAFKEINLAALCGIWELCSLQSRTGLGLKPEEVLWEVRARLVLARED
jgi:hypothetical protein